MKLFQTKHITVSIAKTSHREKLEGLVFWGIIIVPSDLAKKAVGVSL
ncbi:hypothetical protein [Lactiplantibacillus plantarum]|nr:hypothetical protein [Lactiplantibacillus plantarum]